MSQTDTHKQQAKPNQRTKKRFRVIVPQEFVQVFHVEAHSAGEAIEHVHDRGEDAEERGIDITWSDSGFIQDLEEKHWHVEEVS